MSPEERGTTAVYTWVDSRCEQFQSDLEKFAETESDRNPERYRDDWNLLKYSLRSLHKHCAWVEDVVLLTARPQVPDWLDKDQVRVVHHDEIIEARYLPTFSTRTIESFLHKLPIATPWFLVMQDDWLFTRDLSPDAFWDDRGRVKVYGTYFGEHSPRLALDHPDLPGQDYFEHIPRMTRPEWWREMVTWLPEDIERTRGHKFRRRGDLRMDRLHRNFLLSTKRDVKAVCWPETVRNHSFVKLVDDVKQVRKALTKVSRKNPQFLCLNDDMGKSPDPEISHILGAFLDQHFPEPSPYEVAQP